MLTSSIRAVVLVLCALAAPASAQQHNPATSQATGLPTTTGTPGEEACEDSLPSSVTVDWVLTPVTTVSVVCELNDGTIVLSNGIVERRIATSPNASTTSLKNLYTDTEMLHEGSQPEAVVSLSGDSYDVGGGTAAGGFVYSSHSIEDGTQKPYEWTPYQRDGVTAKPWSEVAPWPAAGKSVVFTYEPHSSVPEAYQDITVKIRYEIYDGIAAMMKKVFVENSSETPVELRDLTMDRLRIKNAVKDRLLVDADYHGRAGSRRNDYDRTFTRTDTDDYREYTILYKNGPAFHVGNRAVRSGQKWETTFESFRSFLLLHSTDHYEAQRMEFKKMYRTVAPQLREDLLFFHVLSDDPDFIQSRAAEAAAVGFESVLQSFGSGFNMHKTAYTYRRERRSLYDHVAGLGLVPGGYQLFLTGKIYEREVSKCRPGAYGNSMGLASTGNDEYQRRTRLMVETTDMKIIEIDGAYPLDRCVASNHAYMVGEEDSRHKQWVINNEMYAYFRGRDIYMNVPDWHYLNGTNKTGVGYEEAAWARPRQEQLLLDRMYIYNGTYEKSPPWAWSFLPIASYKDGGDDAQFGPQSEKLFDYNWAVAQNFLSGVQHTFRGDRLFDTEGVKEIVKYWVDVYKTYRQTLKSDVVHIKPPKRDPENWTRATGVDAFLHAAPGQTERALVVAFNQTDSIRTETLSVPLYHAGLTDLGSPPMSAPGSYLSTANDIPPHGPFPKWEAAGLVPDWSTGEVPPPSATDRTADFHLEGAGEPATLAVDSNGNAMLEVSLPPMSFTWYVVTETGTAPAAPPAKPRSLIPIDGSVAAPWVSGLSGTSVGVSWMAPTGSWRVDRYEYRYRAVGSTAWTTGESGVVTSASLAGLATATRYEVQVRATFAGATGEWSASGFGATLQGPGLGNLSYPASQVGQSVASVSDASGVPTEDWATYGTNIGIMVNGYFLTVFAQNGGEGPGGFLLYDVSNPYKTNLFRRIYEPEGRTAEIREAHSMGVARIDGSTYVAVQSTRGIEFWDFTDVDDIRQVSKMVLPGVNGGDYFGVAWQLWWQAPYVYVAGSSRGLFVVDASNPAAPYLARLKRQRPNPLPPGEFGGFKVGPVFAMGNHLVLTSMQSTDGWASLDISDPLDPVLLDRSADMAFYYSACFDGKRMYSATRGDGNMVGYDLSNPAEFVLTSETETGNNLYCAIKDDLLVQGGPAHFEKLKIRADGTLRSLAKVTVGGVGEHGQISLMGNLIFVGDDHGVGSAFAVASEEPDRTAPKVLEVSPRNGAVEQALTSRIGIGFSDSVLLESIGTGSLRLVDDEETVVAGTYSAQLGMVNFAPAAPLKPNTTYTVLVPAGGVVDYAGNHTASSFRSTFTTGASPAPGDAVADGVSPETLAAASTVGVAAEFAAVARDGATYHWDFGDGSASTTTSGASTTHTYAGPGHYTVVLTVTVGSSSQTYTFVTTVSRARTANAPTASSMIAGGENLVFNVNPDNGTVTAIHRVGLNKQWESHVGRGPRSLAVDRLGRVWVAVREDDKLVCLDTAGEVQAEIAVGHGGGPFGIAFVPGSNIGLVTLQHSGEVLRFDAVSGTILGRALVNAEPRGVAVASDGTAYVTRLRSTSSGLVTKIDAATLAILAEIELTVDTTTVDSEDRARGRPNYLNQIVVSPDGTSAWAPAKKDNVLRGTRRDTRALTHETTVRTMVARIDLGQARETPADRIDFNDRDSAHAVAFSPLGDYVFVALQGSNTLEIVDAYTGAQKGGVKTAGLAPQGVWIDEAGRLAFVYQFTTRSVAVYDIDDVLDNVSFEPELVREVATVASDVVDDDTLRGLQIFYDASDRRMSRDGYLSCASCHLEGGEDGAVWDFTDRGEGLRNTISLLGRRGTGHGKLHWTANFDEIQDFENDIRNAFGGTGFLSEADFERTTDPLGVPKAGLSADLDALARYVASLNDLGRSPYRTATGELTTAAIAGRRLFTGLGCDACHVGGDFTDGLRHDVGTVDADSGKASGMPFGTGGVDTPTLLGVWRTAPYFHRGSEPTLDAVIASGHGVENALSDEDRAALVVYLRSLERPLSEYVSFKQRDFDQCWSAEATAGMPLVTTACDGNSFSQMWRFDDASRLHPMQDDDLCLEAGAPSKRPGTVAGAPVVLARCTDASNQRWVVDVNVLRCEAHPGYVVDIVDYETGRSRGLNLRTFNPKPRQVWQARYHGQPQEVSADAALSSLSLSVGEMTFASEVFDYALSVASDVAETTFEATPRSAAAQVTIEDQAGSTPGQSRTVQLTYGENVIDVEVIAEDEQIANLYTVVVTRNGLPGAPLGLTAAAGDSQVVLGWLPPANESDFPVDRYEYRIDAGGWQAVAGGTAARTVTVPGLTNDRQYVFGLRIVNGNGAGIPAEIVAAPTVLANLSVLSLTGVDIGTFAAETTSYTASVGHEVAETTVTATAASAGATVTIADGDGNTTDATRTVRLATGANTITITVVVGESEATKTYTVTVTRAALPVVTLAAGVSPVSEGTAASFDVTVEPASDEDLTVTVSVTETGSALSGAAPATVTVAAAATGATLSVATDDDTVSEPGSDVTVTLQAGTDYAVGSPASATVTVVDDDVASFSLSAAPAEIEEGENSALTVAVTNDVTFAAERALALQVSGVSASDYSLAPETLTLPAGSSSASGMLSAVLDDLEEAAETAQIAVLLDGESVGSAAVTITDAVPPPIPGIAGVPQVGGSLEATFEEPAPADLRYQWLRGAGGEEISGAVGASYTAVEADEDQALSVRVDLGNAAVAQTSAATAPVWPAASNPPLHAYDEELLGATMTLGSSDAFPFWLAGYGRFEGVAFGSMDRLSFSVGDVEHELTVAMVNAQGGFALQASPRIADVSGLVVYWNDYRIESLAPDNGSDPQFWVASTPQPKSEYGRYWRGASDGVQVALSIRRPMPEDDASLSALTLSDVDIGAFDSEVTSYTAEVGFSVEMTTLEAVASDDRAVIEIADSVGSTMGPLRTSRLAGGANEITVTVTAADQETTRTYAVTVTRSVPRWGSRLRSRDISLSEAETATGVWSDGSTMWVVTDRIEGVVQGYSLADGSRLAERDLELVGGYGYTTALWSDGSTLWAADYYGGVLGYRLSDGARLADKDLDGAVLSAAGNDNPGGLWSDGTTLWVADHIDGWVYAYLLSDGSRVSAEEFSVRTQQHHGMSPFGLWFEHGTVLASYWARGLVKAYRESDGSHLGSREIDTGSSGNDFPRGLWSDGSTLWVADEVDLKLYAYAVAVSVAAFQGSAESGPFGPIPPSWAPAVPSASPGPPVFIPDAGLRSRLEAALGKAPGESIGTREMAALEALNLDGSAPDLWALTGLVGLKRLSLRGNDLEDLTALLLLTNLEVLDIGENRITDLSPLAGLVDLRHLSLQGNGVWDLGPLAGLVRLRTLDVRDNPGGDLSPLAGLPELELVAPK